VRARRRIGVVTSSRADYGHLRWPLREMAEHPDLDPRLYVTGAHLSDEFGTTLREIERDGQNVAAKIESLLSSDTGAGAAKTIAVATLGFADLFARERPDIVLLIADRYEMLAPAVTALTMRIPVAHIEGGEISEGAIDDAVRNALTRLAHLHFATTQAAAVRMAAYGEEPWRILWTGSPSLDQLRRERLPDAGDILQNLGLPRTASPLLVAYHPVTLADSPLDEPCELLAAFVSVTGPIVFCFPNADPSSRAIRAAAETFCASRPDARLVTNFAPTQYLALLGASTALVGNSSSGIMEAASLGVPVVDIGARQRGRERAANVVWAPGERTAIVRALAHVRSPAFRASLFGLSNPYGDGRAAERIAERLASAPLGEIMLVKRAMQLVTSGDEWRWVAQNARPGASLVAAAS
jgi:UDP-hydrolysing UDP-N-acetyl-D-glucosamine 2-epimerase